MQAQPNRWLKNPVLSPCLKHIRDVRLKEFMKQCEGHVTLDRKQHIKEKKKLWTLKEGQNSEKIPEKWKQEGKEKKPHKPRKGWKP